VCEGIKIVTHGNMPFDNYNFSDKQLNLMNNFTLCYECLDARDDYSAQMKDSKKEDNQFWDSSDNNCYDFDWFRLYSCDQRQLISKMFSSIDLKECFGFYSKVLS